MTKPTGDKFVDVPIDLISQLLTSSELRMVQNRWEILNLLLDGLSIRQVSSLVHVGTDTVMRTSKMLENEALRKAIVSIRANIKKDTSLNPWVIGSSGEERDY